MGISTAVLLAALWGCDTRGMKNLYYLSTDPDAEDFSSDRIDPIIEESAHLDEITGRRGRRDDGRKSRAADNRGLRHIGIGSLYCRGMYTKRKVKSIDGDAIILDELDECNQENRKFAEDRIAHSEIAHVRMLSQPSIPNYAIDLDFARSDQRYWHLICPACNARTCLELELDESEKLPIPQNILPVPPGAKWAKAGQKYYRACRDCHSSLDMACGEWIPQNPGAAIRGYHVSALYSQIPPPMHADRADQIMDEILSARTTRERMRVVISVFGFPYGGERQPITDAALFAAEGEKGFFTGKNTYIGIDQGDVLHITVGEEDESGGVQIAGLYITDSWDEVKKIFTAHRACALAGDALPNKSAMKKIARETGGHIVYFAGDELRVGQEDDVKKITVDRTEALDEAVRWIVEREIILPARAQLDARELSIYEMFCAHAKMLVKNIEENARGVARWHYAAGVENHFGMALAYMILAHAVGARTAPFAGTSISHARARGWGADMKGYDHGF